MKTRVQKWGHSLAVRIPRSFAKQAGLEENAPVEMSLADGKLLIEPIAKGNFTLHELLDGVTEENLHGEIPTGPRVGKEVW